MDKNLKQYHKDIDRAWLGIDLDKYRNVKNPLIIEDKSKPPGYYELKLMRDPWYLSFACKILLGIDLLPEQAVVLYKMWTRPFPMFVASRGFGKSWLMAVYCMLRMILTPAASVGGAGCKIVIVGAAFRQSKVIFEYMETIWRNAPVFRDLCDNNSGPHKDTDRCTMSVNENWTIAVPLGDGTKIRGLRATIIVADEFGSIPPAIYETVVQGFATVSANPLDNVKEFASRAARKRDGTWTELAEEAFQIRHGNQIIISGTADYDFKHYADYWKKYCAFIRAKNNKFALHEQGFTDKEMGEGFNSSDYCVIRIPYKLIPKGFMDDKVVARAKATVHSGIYQMEYGACFTADSDGFFKRSLIEACVATEKNINKGNFPLWCPIPFDAVTRGNPTMGYVYGIDPASEADNFSIVVLEIHPEHQRVVYCWTTNREDFKNRQRAGLTETADFYGFCARKIRSLMTVFPPASGHPFGASIGMDAQGGGVAVMEALHDPDKMKEHEIALWPIIDPDKPKDTDDLPGLHIVDLIQFAKADWTSDANHGARKDMEDKVLLFPRFDPVTLELSVVEDTERAKEFKAKFNRELTIYDSLEDAVLEIEELKNELTTIVMTRTGTGVSGRDRWDTPEIKTETGKKGHLRKDRYSSLIIANMVARQIQRKLPDMEYEAIGGFVGTMGKPKEGTPLYRGPEWFTKGTDGFAGFAVHR